MKNKKTLFVILGICITIAFLLAINVLFPVKEKNIEVLLDKDSTLNENLKNASITRIPDSEKDQYLIEERDKKTTQELNENQEQTKNYNKTQFSYNINDEKIEIVGYNGSSKNIIIPTKIDNYEVTKVDLTEISKNVNSIYIPNTVTEIEGKIEEIYSNKNSAIMVNATAIISLIIYIIAIGTLSNKNLEENFYNSTTYIFSIIYLIITLILCFINKENIIIPKTYGIVYGVITIIYLLLIGSLRFYKGRLLNNNDK